MTEKNDYPLTDEEYFQNEGAEEEYECSRQRRLFNIETTMYYCKSKTKCYRSGCPYFIED